MLSVFVLLISGCAAIFHSGEGGGSLTITIAGGMNRTLAPAVNMEAASYIVTLQKLDAEEILTQSIPASTTSVTMGKLEFGDWTVRVDAYNGETPSPRLIGTGEDTIKIETKKTASVIIVLGGTGTLDLAVAWSGSIENVSVNASLTPLGETGQIAIPPLSVGVTDNINKTLAAGYYTLAMQLRDDLNEGKVIGGAVETVRIVEGFTTQGTVSFVNLTEPLGTFFATVTIDLRDPVLVTISRATATGTTAGWLNFVASGTGSGESTGFDWFVNGAAPPEGSFVSATRLSLPTADLAETGYRIDAVAILPDGSRSGSASFSIDWLGMSETQPSGSGNSAYYDLASNIPWFWDGTEWQPFNASLEVTVGAGKDFSTIQDAIDAPYPAGYTILVDAGTYDGFVDVNKQVSIIGAGSGTDGTVLVNSAVQGDFVKLPSIIGITYTYRPTLVISASGTESSPLLLKNLRIGERANIGSPRPGILLRPGADASRVASYANIRLENVHVEGHAEDYDGGSPTRTPVFAEESGFAVDGSTSLQNLVVADCLFKDMIYGVILYNDATNSSTASDIEISDTVFTGNAVKGVYAEKLSNATFSNVTVTDNGNIARAPYYWAGFNAGIDINLKFGAYTNLNFNNLTVSGNGLGSYAGAGLTIKARGSGTGDSATYVAKPASLSKVKITNGSYSGNEVGIRFGEIVGPAPPNYLPPTVFGYVHLGSPTEVSVVGNVTISGNVRAQLLNLIDALTLAGEVRHY